jgi:hypothetical protein
VGIRESQGIYNKAYKNYKQKFGETCLDDIKEFVREINGFNRATRWAWRIFLKTKV